MLKISRRHFLAGSSMLLAAQSFNFAVAAPAKGGTLRVSVDQAVSVIHPLLTRVNPEYLVAEMLYSGLTRLGADMSVEPDLATEWSSSDDLTEWTFKLRDGVKFHDGSPLTAADVVESYKALLNPDKASPARNNVGPIASVSAADP